VDAQREDIKKTNDRMTILELDTRELIKIMREKLNDRVTDLQK